MKKPKILDYNLTFPSFCSDSPEVRDVTDQIVLHHTGSPEDDDLSAEDIHDLHQSMGWAGIGYHFIIRKDGTIERGRPQHLIGAHAYGENSHTIGIHLSGNFNVASPTKKQIEAASRLIAWLTEEYDLNIITGEDDPKEVIVGHRDLMATACPGDNLYNQLDTIRGKAIWYRQNA